MNKQLEANDSAHGSAQEWDAIWKTVGDLGHARAKVFTRSTPKTIYEFWQKCYFEDLLLTMQPQPDWAFLELASGRGTTSTYLASKGFKNITLLDLSESALEQAKKNFISENFQVPQTIVGNAEATGLPPNSFDCIYNIGVLEHFEDPSAILAESLRLLKPGGKIFMPIVPAMPYSHSILSRVLFNPLSLARQIVKKLLRRASTSSESTMVRTSTNAEEYLRVARKVGFSNAVCVSYNPYWKLYSDNSRIEDFFIVPIYRRYYALRSILGFVPRLRTFSITSSCLLLTASK
ncbi:MAG: class I SAM-dependent methyltransferase [Pirellula sp.]|jgi:ubiquinone/menaquinone biosynthesis C-methylase UbiE